jgi:hypothetical protein
MMFEDDFVPAQAFKLPFSSGCVRTLSDIESSNFSVSCTFYTALAEVSARYFVGGFVAVIGGGRSTVGF